MITVVCADASHARGKVAKMAGFQRAEHGAWTYSVPAKRRRADTAAVCVCKLCGATLPGWAMDRRVCFAVLNWLDKRGRVEVTHPEFIELASKVEKRG